MKNPSIISSVILKNGKNLFTNENHYRKLASFSKKIVLSVKNEGKKNPILQTTSIIDNKVLKIIPPDISHEMIKGNIVNFYDITLADKVLNYQYYGHDYLSEQKITKEQLLKKYKVKSTMGNQFFLIALLQI